MRKILSLGMLIGLLYFPLSVFGAYDSTSAENYLAANAGSPWATMALVAANVSSVPSGHLTNLSPSSAIEYAAPILAITALNEDPRTFGSVDLVAGLKSHHNNNQIGDVLTLNDDIFGILALASAGEETSDPVINDAQAFILANQNPDGGWGFTTSSSSDTNMTATAIMALVSSGVSSSDSQIQLGISYLQAAQNNDGGFPYDPNSAFGTDSDSSSTAWVIWALNSLNISPSSWTNPSGDPISYLESTQHADGYFEYQTGSGENAFTSVTTAYAVIALNKETLPINTITPSLPAIPFRIEGSANTVCSGAGFGPSALDLVKNVANTCNFSYHITQASFGPYLDQINSDLAVGFTGWLYLVNYEAPNVGAADFVLQEDDELLWFYGDFGSPPTRLSLNNSTATVESYADNTWTPLVDAEVFYGANSATTDSSGQAVLSPNDGFYQIYAEKEGYIRSNSELLEVGEPAQGNVDLNVNVVQGDVGGDNTNPGDSVVAFIVDPSTLDFGTLNPGTQSEQTVTLTNTGNTAIMVQSVVSGNSLFTGNLLINSTLWQWFQTSLVENQAEDITLRLTIPSFYSDSGNKSGTITFWAQVQ